VQPLPGAGQAGAQEPGAGGACCQSGHVPVRTHVTALGNITVALSCFVGCSLVCEGGALVCHYPADSYACLLPAAGALPLEACAAGDVPP